MESLQQRVNIKYDRIIDITDFESLKDTTAVNKRMLYSEFLQKLHEPKITDEKGSAGGFIGGYVQKSRSKRNTNSRSCITLDIDQIPKGLNVWKNIQRFANFAVTMYSTHNHKKDEPRYRIIIPLLYDIEPEYYKKVMEHLTGVLQIEIDQTSYTVSQMMYYPTYINVKDYEFYYQDKPFFDPTIILESKAEEVFDTEEKRKIIDPRSKKNWIGAWTNVYSITDVLDEFLADVYGKFGKNRYTYLEGSSEGGLVIYDNLHAQSHHSTDPISGKYVNSFDLFRLHKFGQLDKDLDHIKNVTDLPSYKAMIQYCQCDEKVSGFYEEHTGYGLHVTSTNLKQVLEKLHLDELDRMEAEWIDGGKNGKKPTAISPVRCAAILEKYLTFTLFDLEENTRLAMYQPEEGIYTRNITIIKRVISWLEPRLNNSKAEDVIYHLTNNAEVKELTNSRHLIPVQNGVFNLTTKTLEPFTPDYVFTTKISTSYVENPINPVIDGWDIESWMNSIACGDSEIKNLLWQAINDSLNGNFSRGKAIFLIGEGNNGKGTYQQLITNLIGMKNIATLKVNEFDQRFRLSMLEGKTAVIGDDVPANVYIDDSSNFNSVVTGDMVSVEQKNKPIYNTIFRCSVIQSTNGMPKFKNKSNGTIRRIVIVPFKADFNGAVENFKIKDEYIKDEKVLQYVLHKAITMDFEKFDVPASSLQELEIFKQDNDPVLDFKLTVFDEWKLQEVPKYVVYGFYKIFCNENGYKPLADRQFHKQFKTYIGDKWEDSQKRFTKQPLIDEFGHSNCYEIGFPDESKPLKTYKNVRLKAV